MRCSVEGEPTPTPSSISGDNVALIDRPVKWLRMSERDSRWIIWSFALAAAVYFIFIGATETGPVNQWCQDVFLLLDGGWRILNGQTPYRDFYLALGPLEYMITAGGMLLTNAGPQGIAIGNVLFGVTVGVWGWLLSRRRMLAVPALLVTAWLILTATSPTPLGSAPNMMSCAMVYNRHGYALLGIVLVECAFSSARSRFWGGASSGIALVLMAFLKLNFFGFAGLLLLASVPVRREEIPRAWGFLAGLACTAVAFAFYLRFAISAFLADMWPAIQAREASLSLAGIPGEIAGRPEVATLAIMTAIVVLLLARVGVRQRYVVRVSLLGGIVIAIGPLLSRTNFGEAISPLVTLWAIVLLTLLTAAYPQSNEKVAICAVVALSLGGVCAGFLQDAQSLRTLLQYQASSLRSAGVSIASPGMDRLRFYDSNWDTFNFRFDKGLLVASYVNDGLGLLEKLSTQDESVLVLGFNNPFSYVLRRKPALGGGTWLRPGDNFPKNRLLEPGLVFGNADLVMVPSYPSSVQQSNAELASAYHPYLSRHFTFVDSSQWWALYRRNR